VSEPFSVKVAKKNDNVQKEMTTCVGEMLNCFHEAAPSSNNIGHSEGMLLTAILRPVDGSILVKINNAEKQTFLMN